MTKVSGGWLAVIIPGGGAPRIGLSKFRCTAMPPKKAAATSMATNNHFKLN